MSAPLDDLMGNALTEPIVDVKDSEDIEIDVVDDRPSDDQVPSRDEDRSSESDIDEEIASVGGGTSKRLSRLKYEYHEQRRAKEAAERMREEAVRFAEHMSTENRDLKDLLHRGERVLLSEIKTRTDSDLNKARNEYKAAYEEGNPDALLKAQEELTRSQYEQAIAERQGAVMPPPPQQPQQIPVQPQVDPKLQEWLQKNEWFGKDEERTSFAYGVHEKLVRKEGVDPRTDDYYNRLDKRIREVFPAGNETGAEEPAASSRSTTVVAPAGRSSGRPRKVQLTSTQVALAKRLGITPEQYAKQLLKEYGNA
jgi:hypothetical protein